MVLCQLLLQNMLFLRVPVWMPLQSHQNGGGSLVIFPFMYYETYGDDLLIKKYYQHMRRYVDYLETRADHYILSFGLGDWYDYGDFRAGFSRNTPVPLVATAHYYMTVMYLTRAARLVGNDYDIHYYGTLANKILAAFNKRFMNEKRLNMVLEANVAMHYLCS